MKQLQGRKTKLFHLLGAVWRQLSAFLFGHSDTLITGITLGIFPAHLPEPVSFSASSPKGVPYAPVAALLLPGPSQLSPCQSPAGPGGQLKTHTAQDPPSLPLHSLKLLSGAFSAACPLDLEGSQKLLQLPEFLLFTAIAAPTRSHFSILCHTLSVF